MPHASFESLEPRRLLAVNFAPKDLADYLIRFTITDGSGEFESSGTFRVRISDLGDDYDLLGQGNIDDTSGTVEFERLGAKKVRITATENVNQFEITIDLDFNSFVSGAYELESVIGSQTGTFKVTKGSASISGKVFDDANSNGRKGPNEQYVADRTIYLDLNDNNKRNKGEPQRTSDEDGEYSFNRLVHGVYTVRQKLPTDHTQTRPSAEAYVIALPAGKHAKDKNFASVNASASARLFSQSSIESIDDDDECDLI